MVHRLRKSLLPLTCICALAAPAVAGARAAVGVSDNNTGMFANHLFTRINITTARDMVSWDAAIIRNKSQLRAAQAWVKAALAAGIQPMISFQGEGGRAGNYVPSTNVYAAAIKAFMTAVPQVKVYSPWNEPDWVYRPRLANNPALAASYYNALVKYCRGCTIAAGELYLPAGPLGRWIRAYARHLNSRPRAWALHNYYDVRTHRTDQVREMQSLTGGQIWLTEISGVIRRGHWQFRNQSPNAAARDEAFLFSLPRRFPRVARIYHYQWQAQPLAGWDSGLLGPGGQPRPAYWTVANAAGLRHSKDKRLAHRK
jgi:putative glycosyl hydrolase